MTKKARLPRIPSDLVLICGRSQADLRGTSFGLRELVQDRLLASAPGARAGATPFWPFLANTVGYRWDFGRDYFFKLKHTDGFCGSQYRRLFF